MKCIICRVEMELIVPDDDDCYLKCPNCGDIVFLEQNTIEEEMGEE